MAFNMLQRRCANLAMNNEVEVSVYPQENIRVINNITFEIDLLQKNNTGKVRVFPFLLTFSPLTWTVTN